MALTSEDISAFAEGVPVYVEAADDGTWRVVDTATGELLSVEHASARTALAAALELEQVGALVKSANLRTDGEPVGEWRWLDATAVEDDPIDGVRIGERAIWEMAGSLNARSSAIPINGGGAPAGMKDSAPHGDAYTGGDHPANGWAHVGIPVRHADERAHLYLWGELLAEVAVEVDSGRLAYGSVRFAFDEVDEDDNSAAKGALLISHALTNDPAVTTLTAGSERYRVPGRPDQLRARRSRWLAENTMNIDTIRQHHATATNTDAKPAARFRAVRELAAALADRGAVTDLINEVAGLLGLDAAEVREDPWKLTDAVWALVDVAKIEDALENAGVANPAEGGDGGNVEAERGDALTVEQREALVGLAKRGFVFGPLPAQRAVEGMEGEDLDAFAADLLALGRMVLGKPDAEAADVLAELQAREEELMAALAGDGGDDEGDDEGMEAAASADLRSRFDHVRSQRNDARSRAKKLQAQVNRFEMRDILDEQLRARKLVIDKPTRERWIEIGLKSGREMLEELVSQRHAPPATNPLETQERSTAAAAPKSTTEAYDLCEDDARRELEEREAKEAARRGRKPRGVQAHVVRARAQKLARERFPEIFETTSAA